jgi:hypothetical protein
MAVDTHHEPHGYWEQWGLARLWFAVLAGPVAVALNMLIGYALVKWACAGGRTYVLTSVAVVTLALALSGTWVGWTCRAQIGDANEHGGRIVDRSYFVALVAIGLSALTALLVVMQAYPHFVLSPCE